jgi:hypothetical protein
METDVIVLYLNTRERRYNSLHLHDGEGTRQPPNSHGTCETSEVGFV